MGQPVKDLSNIKCGLLTPAWPVGINSKRRAVWLCFCECGNQKLAVSTHLVMGHTRSCGCLFGKSRIVHGYSRTSEYHALRSARDRCLKPSHKFYPDYGGRGITICERWLGENGCVNFIKDMGMRPSTAHSLDRINVNGNYEPSNCRWATAKVQMNNRRVKRLEHFSDEEIKQEFKKRSLTVD